MDRPRPVNNIFICFPTEIKKFQENLTSASNLYVLKKGAFVLMSKARDQLQTKTNHYNMIFELVIYIITIKLSFRIKKGFCVLVDNS